MAHFLAGCRFSLQSCALGITEQRDVGAPQGCPGLQERDGEGPGGPQDQRVQQGWLGGGAGPGKWGGGGWVRPVPPLP